MSFASNKLCLDSKAPLGPRNRNKSKPFICWITDVHLHGWRELQDGDIIFWDIGVYFADHSNGAVYDCITFRFFTYYPRSCVMLFPAISNIILIITAGTLFYAAQSDFRNYTIPNGSILFLIVLFFVHAFVSGRWPIIHYNLGIASIIFTFCIVFYWQKLMGGGDVKIITVAFLWVGIDCALPLAILILLFSTVHVVAMKLGFNMVRSLGGRMKIPFAPSVAAALVCMFFTDCFQYL
jgi:prepilin peptidase CpaA